MVNGTSIVDKPNKRLLQAQRRPRTILAVLAAVKWDTLTLAAEVLAARASPDRHWVTTVVLKLL
jgi:hypothetical protein